MNFSKVVFILVPSLLFTSSLSAASLDLREEYKHGSKDWAGRAKISGGIKNHFFGVEVKHSGNLSTLQRSDSEVEYGYKYNLYKLQAIPGLVFTFGDESTTYKPQIRFQYKFNNGVTAKFRYRHEFRNYAAGKQATGRDGEKHDFLDRTKLTGNIVYIINKFMFDFELNYAEDFFNDKWKMGNNGKYEWDYNLKIGYKIDNSKWRPYVEFGNVQCTSSDCDSSRQLRSRLGISYNF